MSIPALRTIGEHVAEVLARVRASAGTHGVPGVVPVADVPAAHAESLALDVVAVAAPGLVVADDVVAVSPVPGFDHAAVDGYAVRLADLPDEGPVTLHVAGAVRAGDPDAAALTPRGVVRIMTGAPLPAGADAVVPVEATSTGRFEPGRDRAETTVTLTRPRKDNVRRRGEDLRAGVVLAVRGSAVTPALVAAAAASGVTHLHVTRSGPAVRPPRVPRVAVISTGSELRPAGSDLGSGGVTDSNSLMLAAVVRAAGADVLRLGGVPDDASSLRAALDAVAPEADLVVTTGGVSAGAWDVVRQILGEPDGPAAGADLTGVAMRPGRPQGLATWRGVPWIALPGTPAAAFVAAHLFVRPAVAALSDAVVPVVAGSPVPVAPADAPDPMRVAGEPLARLGALASGGRGPLTRVVPVRTADDGTVTPTAGSGGHALSALLDADGLALVPPQGVRPGDPVEVVPL